MPNLHITGGSRVGVEICSRLAKHGHTVSLLIPAGRKRFPVPPEVEVIECHPRVSSPLLAIPVGLASMAFAVPQVDVIMASMPPHVLLANWIGFTRRIPAVNYLLNDDVHFFDDGSFLKSGTMLRFYRGLARLSLRTGYLLANSHWTAVRCVAEGGVRPQAIVPHGYDESVFKVNGTDDGRSGRTRIVTVGRKIRWKGFKDLVVALRRLDPRTHPFDLHVITQDDLDYSSAAFPIKTIKPKNDEELAQEYRSGDIFVHSSWFEGFGMPPLEAQASGLAVVATNSGGVREFLKNTENALIVPPREPGTLAKAIKRLIDDEDLRTRLIQNGLSSCPKFTWDKVLGRMEDALMKIIAQHAHDGS